jgi:hypothetical protein
MGIIINNKKILGTEPSVNPGDLGLFAGSDDNWYAKKSDGTSYQLGLGVYTKKLEITSAQVLTLNSSPVQFGISVPTGYYIQGLKCFLKAAFNSSAYTSNTNLAVRAVSSTRPQFDSTSYNTLLDFTSSTTSIITEYSGQKNEEQFVANADLEIYCPDGGDPSSGDSDITIYLTYTFIEI